LRTNVIRVPLVRLLLAHITGPDLRRISDPDLVPQILDQFDKPLAVARGLHPDQHRPRQLLIEALGVAAGMHQLPLPSFPPSLCPANSLVASWDENHIL